MTPLDRWLAVADRPKQTGPHTYVSYSRTREEKTPSVYAKEAEDGKLLLHDFGGDSVQEILRSHGLEWKDIFPENNFTPPQKLQYKKQIRIHEIESALYHELLVLMMVISNRVTSCQLASDNKFRDQRPDWRPMPESPWERELLAVRRIRNGLEARYG